jgi:bis(5'-nucleosyl)-tetraphosphatase (symmetrical)
LSVLVVGDIQGCDDSLQRLLQAAPAHDRIVFLGDLVNRGPQSLRTLRRVRAMGDAAQAVLGNHDLHLLAVASGIRPEHRNDTLREILDAPDRAELLDWVRRRPLALLEEGVLMVHAGVLPAWSAQRTLSLAHEVESQLRSPAYREFLATMYGNQPARWSEDLTGADRLRCILNALTRVRYVDAEGTMDLKLKQAPADAPAGRIAWFDHPERLTGGTPVLFGHWSTLGLMMREDAICLDTGCVWGGQLTALSWPARSVYQVPCPCSQRPTAAG